MHILIQNVGIDYEGNFTTVHGIFTDDSLALKSLQILKEQVSKENHIKEDEWKEKKDAIGFIRAHYKYTYEIYLKEVIENQFVEEGVDQ